MKTTTTNQALSCAIFGHNFFKSDQNPNQLVCAHCNITVQTDAQGNFDESGITNKNVQTTLRRLFLLKRRIEKPSLLSD